MSRVLIKRVDALESIFEYDGKQQSLRAILLGFKSDRLGTKLFVSASVKRCSEAGYEVGIVVRQSGDKENEVQMRKQALNTFNKLPEILFYILGKAQTESFLAVSDFAIIDRDNFWAENLPPAREISVPDVDMEDASITLIDILVAQKK